MSAADGCLEAAASATRIAEASFKTRSVRSSYAAACMISAIGSISGTVPNLWRARPLTE